SVHFSATVQDPDPNDGISFTNLTWDFGDNSTAAGLTADHSYADNGVYTVTFRATYGATVYRDTLLVTVANLAPANVQPDTGRVVGSAVVGGVAHAFLWLDGTSYDLNDLIPAGSGWVLNNATRASGRSIVGNGTLGGQPHAFLIQEPVYATAQAAPPN